MTLYICKAFVFLSNRALELFDLEQLSLAFNSREFGARSNDLTDHVCFGVCVDCFGHVLVELLSLVLIDQKVLNASVELHQLC